MPDDTHGIGDGIDGIAVHSVTVGYGRHAVLDGFDLDIPARSTTVLVGPNGCGKSTLLATCARLLRPRAGVVTLDGRDIARRSTRAIARRLAVLPQSPPTPAALSVRELVEQGRYAQVGPLRMLRRQDHAAIDRAIEQVGLTALADRDVDTLSGGERQRAWLALALAQETGVLALDEPTTALDVGHRLEILELVARLKRERGLTVLMVLHDLDHAARFADHLVVMHAGRVVAAGAPAAILDPPLLRRVFGVEATVTTVEGTPVIVAHRAVPR